MNHGAVILVVLVVLLLFAFPRTGAYNANWGYYPMGGIGAVVIVVLVLLLLGVL